MWFKILKIHIQFVGIRVLFSLDYHRKYYGAYKKYIATNEQKIWIGHRSKIWN